MLANILECAKMSYGRWFEELEAGQQFKHWPGRTITEFDDTLFSLMSMNQHPLHVDEHYAKGTQHGQRLVEGPLVISLLIGMTQADICGRAVAVLEYEDIKHLGPIFHGDSIYAESTILDTQELADEPDRGVVLVETKGLNQRGETILSLRQKIVVPRQLEGGPVATPELSVLQPDRS
jgi:acyl dehydratase